MEALPKCSKISKLHLKNLKPAIPLPNLLKGLSQSLTDLHIHSCETSNIIGKIDESITFNQLKKIKFSGSLGNLNILLTPAWKAVTLLEIDEGYMTPQDISALCKAFSLGYLPKVNSTPTKHPVDMSTFYADGVVPLLSGAQEKVDSLHLNEHKFFTQAVMAIAEANKNSLLPSVTKIFCENKIITGELKTLPSSKWDILDTLHLKECALIDEDLMILCTAKNLGNLPCLKKLLLDENKLLSNAGLISLLKATWSNLEELNLNMCSLDSTSVRNLGQANEEERLPCLKGLWMADNPDISGNLRELLSTKWSVLEKLSLNMCSLDSSSVRNLGQANEKERLPCLKGLWMADNPEISGSLEELLSTKWSVLEKLSLELCHLSSRDAEVLGIANQNELFPNLQELELSSNSYMSGAGLRALLRDAWPLLRLLRLSFCSLRLDDIFEISLANKRESLPCMQILDLTGNPGISGGLAVLLKNSCSTLECLHLRECSLTADDGNALFDAVNDGRFPKLRRLPYISLGNHIPSDIIKQLKLAA